MGSPGEKADEEVDVRQAREYMKTHAEPVISKLVQQLAVSQPADALAFMLEFAQREIAAAEAARVPLCCVSGVPSEVKVRLKSGEVQYYAQDILDALKRKNKLPGAVEAAVDEAFPEVVPEDFTFKPDPKWEARIAEAKTTDQIDDKPVTPPKRGFTMALPGQNFHDDTIRTTPLDVAPVKFEPRALGTASGEGGNDDDQRAAASKAAARRVEEEEAADRLTPEQREVLKVKRKKDELVGRIQALYASSGGVAPLGLAASSVETLRKHLAKLQARMGSSQKQAEREEHHDTTEKREAAKQILEKLGGPGAQAAPSVSSMLPTKTVAFESRALGTANAEPGSGNQEDAAELTPQERRRRAAEAAARRFQVK